MKDKNDVFISVDKKNLSGKIQHFHNKKTCKKERINKN